MFIKWITSQCGMFELWRPVRVPSWKRELLNPCYHLRDKEVAPEVRQGDWQGFVFLVNWFIDGIPENFCDENGGDSCVRNGRYFCDENGGDVVMRMAGIFVMRMARILFREWRGFCR
jgi:hypothetical protein